MLAAMNDLQMPRRAFLAIALSGLLTRPAAAAAKPTVTVYKEPT
jgi:hypothetical protein